MNKVKSVSIHVDVDSPIILSRFYGHKNIEYSISELERFYTNAFQRAFSLFDEFGIKATFFCVGEELTVSDGIADVIREAHKRGHSIANHTFSHPFGLNLLNDNELRKEIRLCNDAITKIISKPPKGFRSPGYAIDTRVINILEENGIEYDSSAGWPLMHILFKVIQRLQGKKAKMNVGYGETNSYFRKSPYAPSKENWKKASKADRAFLEFPLPSSFNILPYYSNFHLLMSPGVRNVLMNAINSKHITYLFHIVEFASSADDFIPKEIYRHPSVQISYDNKLLQYRTIIERLLKSRVNVLTEDFGKNL
jgi:peptidoglycan/xylan/chitin deacetylase (PgdA/CDA1 family)